MSGEIDYKEIRSVVGEVLDDKLEPLKKLCSRHDTQLNGSAASGSDGLVLRVDRIEQVHKTDVKKGDRGWGLTILVVGTCLSSVLALIIALVT